MLLIILNRVHVLLMIVALLYVMFGGDNRIDLVEFGVITFFSIIGIINFIDEFKIRRFFQELDG